MILSDVCSSLVYYQSERLRYLMGNTSYWGFLPLFTNVLPFATAPTQWQPGTASRYKSVTRLRAGQAGVRFSARTGVLYSEKRPSRLWGPHITWNEHRRCTSASSADVKKSVSSFHSLRQLYRWTHTINEVEISSNFTWKVKTLLAIWLIYIVLFPV
jgi:hypothetical protein